MIRRVATIAAISTLLVALSAVPALAWGNGPSDNGYGTHDWLLEHAIDLAGDNGSWVDVEAALHASDDPDYEAAYEAGRGKDHLYKDDSGTAQGGPQAVADSYADMMEAYNKGEYTRASEILGVMSHYFSDICQPYHTKVVGSVTYYVNGVKKTNPRHQPYEIRVSDWTRKFSDRPDWVNAMPRKNITDVRQTAVDAALYARSKYYTIDNGYYMNGTTDYSDDKMSQDAFDATGYALNRSINDLADMIQTIPTGGGLAKTPTTMKHGMQVMPYRFPRLGTKLSDSIRSEVRCYDDAGKPMRGIAVTFVWPLATGNKYYTTYTDGNGLAYSWQAPGYGIPLMRKRFVTAKTVQASHVATSSAWYMPTPELKLSTPGFKATISNAKPKRNTTVKAYARARDTNGRVVTGLPVYFSWYFKSGVVKTVAYTNKYGYAVSAKNIGGAAKGYKVYVKTRTYAGRHTRNSYTTFIPQ